PEIILHPQIVIAHKKIKRDSTIADFSQFSEHANKSFGNHVFIFKPKIEQISEQKNGSGIFFNLVQPAHKFRFPISAGFSRWGAQIDRKSTRLNSSHVSISYAVFCLKKKNYYFQ